MALAYASAIRVRNLEERITAFRHLIPPGLPADLNNRHQCLNDVTIMRAGKPGPDPESGVAG